MIELIYIHCSPVSVFIVMCVEFQLTYLTMLQRLGVKNYSLMRYSFGRDAYLCAMHKRIQKRNLLSIQAEIGYVGKNTEELL